MLGVLSYLCVKLFSGELSMDFTKLSATELVNLLLAFFSIALSAAFYFAAATQSNQFYDNVNKFSKETSELLGRVDEQVKGIGGRQTELKDSIDKYYLRDKAGLGDQAREDKETVVAKAREAENNLSQLVAEILDKTNMPAPERAVYETKLKEKDAELSELRESIGRLTPRNESRARSYTMRQIRRIGIDNAIDIDPAELLVKIAKDAPRPYLRDLASLGFISSRSLESSSQVTNSGKQMIKSALESILEHADSEA